MSEARPSFIDLALGGQARPEEIDDFVDRWHEEPDGELHAYLGMTEAEYALWLSDPDSLPRILQARRHRPPLDAVVNG
jgi:hypothetical protein